MLSLDILLIIDPIWPMSILSEREEGIKAKKKELSDLQNAEKV